MAAIMMPIIAGTQRPPVGHHRPGNQAICSAMKVHARRLLNLALTYDPRVIDRTTAVQFLVTVKQMIEVPETPLIEG